MQLMGAGIRELCDSPLLLLYPQSRTLLEVQKAAYAELTSLRERVEKLEHLAERGAP